MTLKMFINALIEAHTKKRGTILVNFFGRLMDANIIDICIDIDYVTISIQKEQLDEAQESIAGIYNVPIVYFTIKH